MIPVSMFSRARTLLIAGLSVGMLLLVWFTPLPRKPQFTLGDYILGVAEESRFSAGWIVLLSCAVMCWSQRRACARSTALRPGHWLWLAGTIGWLLLFLLGIRGGEIRFALEMLPPLLLCGVCWIAGWRVGRGFAVPLLLLYAFSPSVANWQSQLWWENGPALRRWFGEEPEQLWLGSVPEWRWQLYAYLPRVGTIVVMTITLCWLARRHWRRALALTAAGIVLLGGHLYLYGGLEGC